MKILLAGQKRFGRDVLELCLSLGHQIAAVCCPVDPADKLWIAAQNHGLRVIPSGRLAAAACPPGLDLIITAHSHDFIGRKTRLRARLGAIGYHPSLLPLHRGRDAVRWAVHNRERITGGTIYWLTDTVDGGPIAAQHHAFIRPADTARDLWARELAPLGLQLFRRVLLDLAAGVVIKTPQDAALATWEPAFGTAPPLFRPELDLLPAYRGHGLEAEIYDPRFHYGPCA